MLRGFISFNGMALSIDKYSDVIMIKLFIYWPQGLGPPVKISLGVKESIRNKL